MISNVGKFVDDKKLGGKVLCAEDCNKNEEGLKKSRKGVHNLPKGHLYYLYNGQEQFL